MLYRSAVESITEGHSRFDGCNSFVVAATVALCIHCIRLELLLNGQHGMHVKRACKFLVVLDQT